MATSRAPRRPAASAAASASGLRPDADTAITAYRIGGGEFPTAMTALVDHFATNWSAVHFTDVHHSNGGAVFDRWGDYQSVNRYLGCLRTWPAASSPTGAHSAVRINLSSGA